MLQMPASLAETMRPFLVSLNRDFVFRRLELLLGFSFLRFSFLLHRKQFFDSFGEASLVDERHVDMGAALRCGFASMGVASERIADVDMCTVCDAGERFYSYRASGGTCGRHGAFAARILG